MLKKIFYLLISITLFCISGCTSKVAYNETTSIISIDDAETLTVEIPKDFTYRGKITRRIHNLPYTGNVYSIHKNPFITVGVLKDKNKYLAPRPGTKRTISSGDCHHNENQIQCFTRFEIEKCTMTRTIHFLYNNEWSVILAYSEDFTGNKYPCDRWVHPIWLNPEQKKMLNEWNRETDNLFTIKHIQPETE